MLWGWVAVFFEFLFFNGGGFGILYIYFNSKLNYFDFPQKKVVLVFVGFAVKTSSKVFRMAVFF